MAGCGSRSGSAVDADHRDGDRGGDRVHTIRRKGVISGSLDTGLNAMPVVGAVKNTVEAMRGRDFFPDRLPVVPNT